MVGPAGPLVRLVQHTWRKAPPESPAPPPRGGPRRRPEEVRLLDQFGLQVGVGALAGAALPTPLPPFHGIGDGGALGGT